MKKSLNKFPKLLSLGFLKPNFSNDIPSTWGKSAGIDSEYLPCKCASNASKKMVCLL